MRFSRRRPTPKMIERFYASRRWVQISAQARLLFGERCRNDHTHAGPFHVDHIISIIEDWTRRFELTNLQVLCIPCHKAKHR